MSHILTENSIGNIHITYLKSLKRTCQLNKQIYKLLISHSCFQLMDARLMIPVTFPSYCSPVCPMCSIQVCVTMASHTTKVHFCVDVIFSFVWTNTFV